MTLLLPSPPAFGYYLTNDDSPGSSTIYGTLLTAGAADTKGSWSAIHSTISYDLYVHDITCAFNNGTTAAAIINFFDLGIGPDAANVTVIAEDLVVDNIAAISSGGYSYYQVPLYIPAGTQLWGRTSSSTASNTMRVHFSSWGAPDHPESYPKISYIESLGENEASTTGTAITAGSSGTLGTSTSMGSFTNDVCAVFMTIGSDDTTMSALGYCGAITTDATATVQELGLCCLFNSSASEENRCQSSVIWCDIPAGQTVGTRISCTGTSDTSMWTIAYGCVRG